MLASLSLKNKIIVLTLSYLKKLILQHIHTVYTQIYKYVYKLVYVSNYLQIH